MRSPLIPQLMALGWGLAMFAALVALLMWKHRRDAARRISKGLRAYTTHAQEVSL